MAGVCACLGVGIMACDDNIVYDVYGDSYNRIYTESKSASCEIVHIPGGTVAHIDFKWVAQCTKLAKGEIKVTVGIDNALIPSYNEEHGSEYEALPTGAIVLENATMTIPVGTRETVDSLHISLTSNLDLLATLKSTKGYLLPLRIVSVEGVDAAMSSNMNLPAFVTFSVTEKLINENATEADITGVLVADQSGWSIEVNSGTGQNLERWFDGDESTRGTITDYSAYDATFTVDMGQVYTFGAITARRVITSGDKIRLSEDGVNFRDIGEAPNGSPVIFYAPIKARYIRVNTGTSWVQGTTFNIYAN